MTWAVNHLAPFRLTNQLLELLTRSAPARIINVSSQAHWNGHIDFEDPEGRRGYRAGRAYAQSKLANILHIKELAVRLAGHTVTANALHPGVVNTSLLRAMVGIGSGFFASPEKGAETSIFLATDQQVAAVSGEYFDDKHIADSSPDSKNPQIAEALWRLSQEYM